MGRTPSWRGPSKAAMTRMRRNGDFINEFAGDIVPHLDLQAGMNLSVQSVCLGEENEEVFAFAVLKVFNGGEVHVKLEVGSLFDPDYGDHEDIADMLEQQVNIDRNDALRRLKERDLD